MKSVAAMKVSSTHGSWRWPVASQRRRYSAYASWPRRSRGRSMPIRRRSAASDGPMLGNCSRRSHSSALFAFGALITAFASHQHVIADQADGESFDGEGVAGADDDRPELRVFGDELDAAARPLEALDGDVVAEPGDDDLAAA